MAFWKCPADVAIYGGSAYCGKTFALLLEALKDIRHPKFNAVYFRREMPMITAGGGPWDTSVEIFNYARGRAVPSRHIWKWANGANVKLTHLQYDADRFSHHSAAYVYIAFDELDTFSEQQFWYIWTRNRPPTGYNGRCWMRAGTNPNADSWVREMLDWWIGSDGYPLPARSGVLRYFTRKDDKLIWVEKDWRDEFGNAPKSLTFISGTIDDNAIGNECDPTYKVNLYAQDMVTRERLLKGNWNITYKGGMFKPDWFKIADDLPPGLRMVRYWDLAATPKDEESTKDPDWSVGALVGEKGGNLYICAIDRLQGTPAEVEVRVKHCAEVDGKDVTVGVEEEKGSSGKYVGDYFKRHVLPEYDVVSDPVSGDKIERAKPWAAEAEQGHVYLLRGAWNRPFLAEAGSFPLQKKDQIDAVSGARKLLKTRKRVWPIFNVGDFKQVRKFQIAWNNYHHYGSIIITPDMSAYVIAAAYIKHEQRLYVYGELVTSGLSLATVADRIVKGMSIAERGIHGFFGHSDMFTDKLKNTGQTLNKELKEACIRHKSRNMVAVRSIDDFDVFGAQHIIGLMIARNELVVDIDCKETIRQMSGWAISDKGKPEEGFYLCKALCMMSAVINKQIRKDKGNRPIDPHYKRIVPKVPEKTKSNSYQIS